MQINLERKTAKQSDSEKINPALLGTDIFDGNTLPTNTQMAATESVPPIPTADTQHMPQPDTAGGQIERHPPMDVSQIVGRQQSHCHAALVGDDDRQCPIATERGERLDDARHELELGPGTDVAVSGRAPVHDPVAVEEDRARRRRLSGHCCH